jgi:hypothetical protein
MSDTTSINDVSEMPSGDYAIVEQLGHRTYVGRVLEIERFGTKMLQIEPLFGRVMLGPIMISGNSLYQLTPVDVATAYARRPMETYQLPACVAATIPPLALPSADELPSFLTASPGGVPGHPAECGCDDCIPF